MQKKRTKTAAQKAADKKVTDKKNNAAKGNSKKKNMVVKAFVKDNSRRNFEIKGLVMVAFGIISICGILGLNVGFIGLKLAKFLQYFFGVGSFLVGGAIAGIGGYYIMKHDKLHFDTRILGGTGFFTCTMALYHHVVVKTGEEILPESLVNGGGLLGGLITWIMHSFVGEAGTPVLLAAGLIVSLLVATTWSLAQGILKTKDKAEKGAVVAKKATVTAYGKTVEVSSKAKEQVQGYVQEHVQEHVKYVQEQVKEQVSDIGDRLKTLRSKDVLARYEEDSVLVNTSGVDSDGTVPNDNPYMAAGSGAGIIGAIAEAPIGEGMTGAQAPASVVTVDYREYMTPSAPQVTREKTFTPAPVDAQEATDANPVAVDFFGEPFASDISLAAAPEDVPPLAVQMGLEPEALYVSKSSEQEKKEKEMLYSWQNVTGGAVQQTSSVGAVEDEDVTLDIDLGSGNSFLADFGVSEPSDFVSKFEPTFDPKAELAAQIEKTMSEPSVSSPVAESEVSEQKEVEVAETAGADFSSTGAIVWEPEEAEEPAIEVEPEELPAEKEPYDYGIDSMAISYSEAAVDATESLSDDAELVVEADDETDYTENIQDVKNVNTPAATNGNIMNKMAAIAESAAAEEKDAAENAAPEPPPYEIPPIYLLNKPVKKMNESLNQEIANNAKILGETLSDFKVKASILNACHGPAVTRYEVKPAPGVKVSKITSLSDDIALNMAATAVRIEQIQGKAAIGIEVPNKELESVQLREVLENPAFEAAKSRLTVGLGKDIGGQAIFADLAKMPHLLVAGATGSGKSVCINTLITSVLFKAKPTEVKFILIDPKMVELSVYNDIPHLMVPVVTDARKAASVLNWAVQEMEKRYGLIAQVGVRNMEGYNKLFTEEPEKQLPSIVIIIDELADLMMVAPHDVEDAICRIAQKARAAGIYLVLATQRPSVNVITGVIKANIPSRISFAVTSQIDSRTILDASGAEKLLGKGDMLFKPQEANKPIRIQGAFVSDGEVEALVDYIKAQGHKLEANQEIIDFTNKAVEAENNEGDDEGKVPKVKIDSLLREAVELTMSTNIASASSFQRRYHIGYSRAGRLLDTMEQLGIVGPPQGSKPREILVTEAQAFEIMDNYENQ